MGRPGLLLLVTLVVLVPIAVVLALAVQPGAGSTAAGLTLEDFARLRSASDVLTRLVDDVGRRDRPSITALAVVVMAPPMIRFAVLHRFCSLGGVGGSLGDR